MPSPLNWTLVSIYKFQTQHSEGELNRKQWLNRMPWNSKYLGFCLPVPYLAYGRNFYSNWFERARMWGWLVSLTSFLVETALWSVYHLSMQHTPNWPHAESRRIGSPILTHFSPSSAHPLVLPRFRSSFLVSLCVFVLREQACKKWALTHHRPPQI